MVTFSYITPYLWLCSISHGRGVTTQYCTILSTYTVQVSICNRACMHFACKIYSLHMSMHGMLTCKCMSATVWTTAL